MKHGTIYSTTEIYVEYEHWDKNWYLHFPPLFFVNTIIVYLFVSGVWNLGFLVEYMAITDPCVQLECFEERYRSATFLALVMVPKDGTSALFVYRSSFASLSSQLPFCFRSVHVLGWYCAGECWNKCLLDSQYTGLSHIWDRIKHSQQALLEFVLFVARHH